MSTDILVDRVITPGSVDPHGSVAPRRPSRWTRAWFWLSVPVLTIYLTVADLNELGRGYLDTYHRAPTLLAVDLAAVSLACMFTRWRWPLTSLVVSLAIAPVLVSLNYVEGWTLFVPFFCLMSVAYRRRPWPVVGGGLLLVGQLSLLGAQSPQVYDGSFLNWVETAVALVAVAVVARLAVSSLRGWRGGRSPATDQPPCANGPSKRGLSRPLVIVGVTAAVFSQPLGAVVTHALWPTDTRGRLAAGPLCHLMNSLNDDTIQAQLAILKLPDTTRADLTARITALADLGRHSRTAAIAFRRIEASQPPRSPLRTVAAQAAERADSRAARVERVVQRWSPPPATVTFEVTNRLFSDLVESDNTYTANPTTLVRRLGPSTVERTLLHSLVTAPACKRYAVDAPDEA